jgi:arabinofuranosyltransferase
MNASTERCHIRDVPLSKTKKERLVVAALLIVAAVELFRTAWMSDDALITLRTVLNVTHGFGARFNIDERVQGYTHPLWFLLIAAGTLVVRNVYVVTFALSLVLSFAALWLLLTRVATNVWAGVLAAGILMLSRAWVDYSSSGLENPLSHVLILLTVLAAAHAIERREFRAVTSFFLLCSLLYLSRADLMVLVCPVALLVLYRCREQPRLCAAAILVGAVPVAAWTLSALYYYGFPFPNTAYAKLATGIPRSELIAQGFRYLLDPVSRDPLTLVAIAGGIAASIWARGLGRALAAGVLLYLAYVVTIGGDFMAGRFLAAPLLGAAIIIARVDLPRAVLPVAAIAVVILALPTIKNTVLSRQNLVGVIGPDGIADERGFYFARFGLLRAPAGTFAAPEWKAGPRSVFEICGGLGLESIRRGPGAYAIDVCALVDPLLARLPAYANPNWRIGHFIRQLPTNYEDSVARNENLLADPRTKAFYDSIRLITRGDLNDGRRLREIVRMNFGLVEKPDTRLYRYVPQARRLQ